MEISTNRFLHRNGNPTNDFSIERSKSLQIDFSLLNHRISTNRFLFIETRNLFKIDFSLTCDIRLYQVKIYIYMKLYEL